MQSRVFEKLTELAAQTVGGTSGLVFARNTTNSEAVVVGRYGLLRNVPKHLTPRAMTGNEADFIAIADVSKDARLRKSPFMSMTPPINSFMAARIATNTGAGNLYDIYLCVYNAPPSAFEAGLQSQRFVKVVEMARELCLSLRETDYQTQFGDGKAAAPQRANMNIPISQTFAENAYPASRFLFETLSIKNALHDRNGASYVSLRNWSKPIKSHQYQALAAIKLAPPDKFVADVAHEMSERARSLFGDQAIESVVPMPDGNAGYVPSLSKRLAAKVAENLEAQYVMALRHNEGNIKRNTLNKKSRVKSFGIENKPKGTVLLIDDSASDSKLLEKAQAAIRNVGLTCFVMSWIGP